MEPRDATIASLYPALTMQQIADRYGITRARVQQILSKRGVTGVARRQPLADRFWPKVRKGEGCWEWQGSRMPNGYGHLRVVEGDHWATVSTHRTSWELTNGPIPEGLNVLHHCDNPPCVRPDHLYVGTQIDNMNDRARRGRTFRRPKSA